MFRRLFGRKDTAVAEPPKAKVPQGEVAYSSSNIYKARDIQLWDPDILKRRKGLKIYETMMDDDQVKPVVEFKKHAVLAREWYFDVDDDDEQAEQYQQMADYFYFVIQKMDGSFSDKLLLILSALHNGFSIVEKVFQPVTYDGKSMWGLKDLKLRPADTFDGGFVTDAHGNIQEVKQTVAGTSITVPMDKIIRFVHQQEYDGCYGKSDLRAAYRPYWSKDIIIKFQNIFLERHASGFFWAQVKEGSTLGTTARTSLQNFLNNITTRAGAIIPGSVELKQFGPASTDAFNTAIANYDKAIARSILVPNLLGISEQGQVGSYSQSQTQLKVFFWIVDTIANRLEEALNEQVFRQLALWNFGVEEFPPFKFNPITPERAAEISKAWSEMVSKGAVTKTDADEGYLRNIMGFPEKPEDEEELPAEPLPDDTEDMPDEPDNADWVEKQNEWKRAFVKKEMAAKPWLRRCNFARIERTLDKYDKTFTDEINALLSQAKVAIEKQVARIAGDRSFGNVKPTEITDISIPRGVVSDMKKAIRRNLTEVLDEGYEQAKSELPRRRHARPIRPGMDKTKTEKFLASKSMKIADIYEQRTLEATQRVLENSIKYDKTLKDTMIALDEDTDLVSLLPRVDAAGRAVNIPSRLENIIRTNTADALNAARQALFTEPEMKGFVLAFEYSAILDDRTTEICEHLNGKILKDFGVYTPPNHFQALPAGTMVTIHGGQKAIEDIKIGDSVLTHAHNFRPVTETMMHETWPEEIVLHLDGGRTLTLTDDHPVLTKRGWVCAGDLTVEDSVMSLSGPCAVCGKPTTNRRFCSNECKAKGREVEAQKTCAHCGKQYKSQGKKYCSRECLKAAGRRYCKKCGAEIMLKGKKKNALYCSQACMGAAMRTLPEKQCQNCGKVLIGKWRSPVSKDRRFCSQHCYMAYKGETSIEETVREFLAVNHIRAIRQYQIGRYYADLYLPTFNMVIEVDGEYWHSVKAKAANVIETRERYIVSKGYAVLHLPESAVRSGRYERKIMEALHEIQTASGKNKQDREAALQQAGL